MIHTRDSKLDSYGSSISINKNSISILEVSTKIIYKSLVPEKFKPEINNSFFKDV